LPTFGRPTITTDRSFSVIVQYFFNLDSGR
jgi:hypothetical protein